MGAGRAIAAVAAASLALAGAAHGQTPGVDPGPIPQDPLPGDVATFQGQAAAADPHSRLRVPRHPFMARNGASNIHNDAYQSDTYNRAGPLGQGIATDSAMFARECASVTFDRRGRIVTICVGLDRPVLTVLDPQTFEPYSAHPLPPRQPSSTPFQSFGAGGYFYLDHRDRVVVPTSEREILKIAVNPDGSLTPRGEIDLRGAVPAGDTVFAVMPDWDGRIWFVTADGIVGFANRRGKVVARDTGEPIGNSFAVDERGGVYVVTDAALYRFEAHGGEVDAVWRKRYPNVGEVKPGQTQAGSGTTPTLLGKRWVAITDNADPMAVMVLKRKPRARGRRLVCRKAVFRKGASSTDQSLIGARRAIVVENNYGYQGPTSTMDGATTSPGLWRVDVRRGGRGCRVRWRSSERAPSVVPKLSLGAGIVYTYTKPPRTDDTDAWYLTAIDFDTGRTLWRRLAGTGFGFNNNFAPVSIGPGGTAYVGVLGGIASFADGG